MYQDSSPGVLFSPVSNIEVNTLEVNLVLYLPVLHESHICLLQGSNINGNVACRDRADRARTGENERQWVD